MVVEKSLNGDLHYFKFLVCQVILHVRIVDLPCLMTGFPPRRTFGVLRKDRLVLKRDCWPVQIHHHGNFIDAFFVVSYITLWVH